MSKRRLIKINSAIAVVLLRRILAYKLADARAKAAKAKLDQASEKYAEMVPDGTEVHVKGHRIIRWLSGGGEVFALKDYKAAGNRVTPKMEPFVRERQRSHVWDATPIPPPE